MIRTLETHLAVFLGAFSLSARRSLVVDFPLRRRASTCSSCPTTAKRAFCATSCATLSAWTPALSSPNSAASGQSSQESFVQQSGPSTRLGLPGPEPVTSKGHHQTKGQSWRTYKLSFCLFIKLDELFSTSALSSKGMLFLQHNPIFLHLLLPLPKFNMSRI